MIGSDVDTMELTILLPSFIEEGRRLKNAYHPKHFLDGLCALVVPYLRLFFFFFFVFVFFLFVYCCCCFVLFVFFCVFFFFFFAGSFLKVSTNCLRTAKA